MVLPIVRQLVAEPNMFMTSPVLRRTLRRRLVMQPITLPRQQTRRSRMLVMIMKNGRPAAANVMNRVMRGPRFTTGGRMLRLP